MLSKKLYYFFLIFVLTFSSIKLNSKEVIIISKINNEIITNVDLENEIKYLLITSSNLKELSRKDLLELSKNSLIREILKKKEIKKFINVNKISNLEKKVIKQHYESLGFDNKSNYINFLQNEGISLELVKNKLITEQLWNTLIYEKFKEKIKIDESTKPIKIPSGNLILKINSKRELKDQFDLDKETKKQIVFEQNRQLSGYSLNYYNKLKQNAIINEY